MNRTRALPVLVPLAVAAVLGVLGHRAQALVLVAVAAVLGAATLAGVDVTGRVARLVDLVVRGLVAVLGGAGFLLVVLPAWAWNRLRRRDVLRTPDAGRWQRLPRVPVPPTSLGGAPIVAGRRPLWRTLVGAVEVVLLVLAINYAAGWTFDRVSGRTGPNSIAEAMGSAPRARVDDPRVDSPAMAGAPWAKRYFADLQATSVGYWPFTEYRPEPYESPHLNLDGWTRRSYQTPGETARRPVVWMFGGSTTFGEGQRDDHTIASELVRLAERNGTPITVANFGQRGWTHWQEMLLFEQRLALEPPPDLAIFYDGANEITSQALLNEAVPSNTLVLQLAERLAGASVATRFVQDGAAVPAEGLWHAYTQHSLAHKLVYAFRPTAADAAPRQEPLVNRDGAAPAGDGIGTDYDLTAEDGTDAGRVYERGRRLTSQIAADAGVEPLFFWQPVRFEGLPQQRALAELGDDVIDLSDALDGHGDTYIDGAHTNEEGARVIAEAIWPSVQPRIEQWYETQG